jgi:hypothetical protein
VTPVDVRRGYCFQRKQFALVTADAMDPVAVVSVTR